MTICSVLALLAGRIATGQPSTPSSLASGGSDRVSPLAAAAVHSVHWEQIALRDVVGRLNGLSDTVIYVDRRIDPMQRISLSLENSSVDELATQLAAACSLGTSQFDRLIYLGPAPSAAHLATLAALRRQEVNELTPAARRSLSAGRRVAWPRLTQPRDLVARLMQDHGWRVRGGEQIPLDLWPAGRLPKLALADQLTLLLIGFDLTYRIVPNESAVELAPIGELPPLVRNYDWRGLSRPTIERLEQQFPQTQLQAAGGKLRAAGRWEDLEAIGQLLESKRRPRRARRPPQATKQVFTLRVEEQPVGAVLAAVTRQTNWQLVVDEAAIRRSGRSLDQRVSFAVENVEIDQLLEALLRPAGLTFVRDGDRLRIIPRRSSNDE